MRGYRNLLLMILTKLIASLARIIVYSIMSDSPIAKSTVPTPSPSGVSTPQLQNKTLGEYLSTPLSSGPLPQRTGYLAGSRALDSLAKLIASTESFFHPSNSGAWTADVCCYCQAQNQWSCVFCSVLMVIYPVKRIYQVYCL